MKNYLNKLLNDIDDLNQETQSMIGTDEGIDNDYADGYQTAINDVIELIKKEMEKL